MWPRKRSLTVLSILETNGESSGSRARSPDRPVTPPLPDWPPIERDEQPSIRIRTDSMRRTMRNLNRVSLEPIDS
jgi:hypothetical protein